MLQPSDCDWVSPEVRPYSVSERIRIRQLDAAIENLRIRDVCRNTGRPWPPAGVRFNIITTRRNRKPHARV